MATLINVDEKYWNAVDFGATAAMDDRKSEKDCPLPLGTPEAAAWLIGYLAEKNAWDIEY